MRKDTEEGVQMLGEALHNFEVENARLVEKIQETGVALRGVGREIIRPTPGMMFAATQVLRGYAGMAREVANTMMLVTEALYQVRPMLVREQDARGAVPTTLPKNERKAKSA